VRGAAAPANGAPERTTFPAGEPASEECAFTDRTRQAAADATDDAAIFKRCAAGGCGGIVPAALQERWTSNV